MPPLPSYRQPLPRWLAIDLPLFLLVYPFLLMVPALNWERHVYREFGLVENLTAIFLLAAVIYACRAFAASRQGLQRCWLALLALGAFVFLGEEISWGQHYFGWSTPEDWSQLNKQRETNLHNISGSLEFLFTRIARSGLSIGCIVGGFLIPWWYRRRQVQFAPGSLQFWLWPSLGGALSGILSNTVGLPNKIANHFDGVLPNYLGPHTGELKECYLALFILLYAMVQQRVTAAVRQAA